MDDIYFDENYGKLYEKIEDGEAVVFKCETANGTIVNQFIKRKIPIKVDEKTYYDLITPYGYGGPFIKKSINEEQLLEDYEQLFQKYCLKNNIVSEFVRFHPIYKNHLPFKKIYNTSFDRYTLATNIKDYEDPIHSEFSKSCRKTIKQVLKNGVSFKLIDKPNRNDMEKFIEIYYDNMARKKADSFYFFENEYFDNIIDNYLEKIIIVQALYEEEIIAAGLYFVTDKNIHAHLSGTKKQFLHLSPAYILKYGTVLWAKEQSFNFIHYGGGTDNHLDNSLFLFKSKFAKNTKLEFYIGKKVWNVDVYDKLCSLAKTPSDEAFFPAYRRRG